MAQIEKDGIVWYVPDTHIWYPALTGHEEQELAWIRANFPHGRQFLDIGAHIGLYSMRLSKNFESVIAVEANPVNTFIIKRNIEINNIKNVDVKEIAAWDRAQMLFFNQELASVGQPPKEYSFPMLGMPIDAYNLSPDFVKMDIEGGEFQAIHGLKETMNRSHPRMMIEVHQYPGNNTLDSFTATMNQYGYKLAAVLEQGIMATHRSYNCIYDVK